MHQKLVHFLSSEIQWVSSLFWTFIESLPWRWLTNRGLTFQSGGNADQSTTTILVLGNRRDFGCTVYHWWTHLLHGILDLAVSPWRHCAWTSCESLAPATSGDMDLQIYSTACSDTAEAKLNLLQPMSLLHQKQWLKWWSKIREREKEQGSLT